MIKAVFIDYTGTTVYQTGKEMDKIVELVQKYSKMHDENEVLRYFYQTRVDKEKESYLHSYLSEDEIIDLQLKDLTNNYDFQLEHSTIKDLIHQFWNNTPVYDDAIEFYQKCPLPIYVLTNNGTLFVSNTMIKNHLNPAAIISSDDVFAYKPKEEIFMRALEIAGLQANEVIHVGDSWDSDVLGALHVGITPVWLQRDRYIEAENIKSIRSLVQLLDYLEEVND